MITPDFALICMSRHRAKTLPRESRRLFPDATVLLCTAAKSRDAAHGSQSGDEPTSSAIEDGAKLTLDHLTPHSRGGSNGERNLITCCHRCNSSRGARSTRAFAGVVASYLDHGITAADILDSIGVPNR